ncbi:MAG: hypothetical protein JXA91_06315 [Candidatus Thermoplasmatota archaeon]|nr:hypothetical protein [Candidatus Thermoplasmatota archaeon]
MEYIYISKFSEEDFDEIIRMAGGNRYTNNPCITEKNCDYILDDAVIELKIIEEEPIEKESKQKKLSSLFCSDLKTVILNPRDLDTNGKRKYYQELATPIKNALKSASKQLVLSADKVGAFAKIAVIINNGLTMTTSDEFTEIAVNRAKNDTTGIDSLITAGFYYYSDTFDSMLITEFKDHHIRGQKSPAIIEKLRKAWFNNLNQYMTKQIQDIQIERQKGPIVDLFFELDGIRYVKPPIPWGKPSSFFGKHGRPREDSTGMVTCPPVAIVLPIFNNESYTYAKKHMIDRDILLNNLDEYLKWARNEWAISGDKFKPVVLIMITLTDLKALAAEFWFSDIMSTALPKFQELIHGILENSKELPKEPLSLNYIFLQVNEIGIDKANDIAFISHIKGGLHTENQKYLIKGERMKFEYAIALAASYCLSLDANTVYYYKNEDFKWK